MDKLRAINIFRKVVELGSFTAVSEEMKLSKAAVSKNINELEAFLQSPLINRTTRKLHVTENGRRYYNHICIVLDELNNADRDIIESTEQPRGLLRISAPMSAGLLLVNPAICEFMSSYPEIQIELVMNDEYADLIDKGFDIAIRGGGAQKSSSLRSRKLMEVERVLCASPEYLTRMGTPAQIKDLHSHNCIVYSLSSSPTSWTFYRKGSTEIFNFNKGTYSVDNGLASKQAALAGLGIILTPKVFVDAELQSGRLISLLESWKAEVHALYAIYPYHNETSTKVRHFVDFLVEKFAQY
ncbi:LysR family transcriptional regulator [Zooshikella marina]|uniref:LysR family transcriptional regulator n=1 Tax=Zooshikella ganghwensis TaxID=202772 RepID=UPI001BB03496|nr:LysR family transcriptional regulator [Zooshikella ganghwensis]MBU2704496.1 LysR family transcriptional regulator [Zooshikella ganghwensis]